MLEPYATSPSFVVYGEAETAKVRYKQSLKVKGMWQGLKRLRGREPNGAFRTAAANIYPGGFCVRWNSGWVDFLTVCYFFRVRSWLGGTGWWNWGGGILDGLTSLRFATFFE